MPLQAQQICAISLEESKAPRRTDQAGKYLNVILSDVCQKYDFDLAKKPLNFLLTPAAVPIGNLNAQLASGPFTLPSDYLRTKIGDVYYYPQGLGSFPKPLTPVDLAEFDGMVQQAGFQSYPAFWVTDMSHSPPLAYVWPPSGGAYPAMVRYYAQMPDIATPETSATVPWFPNQQYLIDKLTSRLCRATDLARSKALGTEADNGLRDYLKMKDDTTNRAQRATLDPRRFGRRWDSLPKSKVYGW